MELSVSKGVFIFKNNFQASKKQGRSKKNIKLSENTLFADNFWYKTYKSLSEKLDTKIQKLNNEMFSKVLSEVVENIKKCYENPVNEIPAFCILTGINMPDHSAQFSALKSKINIEVTPHVASLKGEDCQSIKYMIESMVYQLVKEEAPEDSDNDDGAVKIKKNQCTFSYLQSWYEDLYLEPKKSPKKQKTTSYRKNIVIIISDFESFNSTVLQDFILITSSYINILPITLVFGVATSISTLHQTIPCHVSSKINIKVFNSTSATIYLNNIIEEVFFDEDCPFHLGGKLFNLFIEIFLFYDLSVSGFIQNFKYAMMEHFSYGNAMALCTFDRKEIREMLELFSHEDFENCRRLLSFRKLVENEPAVNKIALLTSDEYLLDVLVIEIQVLQHYIKRLHLFLKCLLILVADLPKAPLGKQLRELYAVAVSKNIAKTPEYKECFQLLNFQSKDELLIKLNKIKDLIANSIDLTSSKNADLSSYLRELNTFIKSLNEENLDEPMESTKEIIEKKLDRKQLKEKLLENTKNKPKNKYEHLRCEILNFLTLKFEFYLNEPKNLNFHEIFFFNDITIQSHIIGSHRAAIHTALTDPQTYLQCKCCHIDDDSIILKTMPDISIAYKLHLECGKMINLFDWLQAFLSIVDDNIDKGSGDENESSKRLVSPELQARFSQAVAELEFLGFVKSSKRKIDHVTRLTWGG